MCRPRGDYEPAAFVSLHPMRALADALPVRADEWLVDISGVDAAALASAERVRALCDDVVASFRLTLLAPPLAHVFPGRAPEGGGVTALYLLSESHLAVHTWPERGGALLSLGTCRPGVPERFSWLEVVRAHLPGAAVAVQRVERSIALKEGT